MERRPLEKKQCRGDAGDKTRFAKVVPLTDTEQKKFWNRLLIRAASGKDNGERIESILKRGADVDARDGQGMTALMYAAKAGNRENVKVLLDNGADVNARDSEGVTPLMDAVLGRDVAIMLMIIERGADTDAQDRYGMTARKWAEEEGHEEASMAIVGTGR